MSDGWSYDGVPDPSATAPGTVTLVEGVTFCISDRAGDIHPGTAQGLFFRETRFLSRVTLDIDGVRLEPLAVHHPAPYAATFIGRRPPRPGMVNSTLVVVRRRYVGNGMLEDITVRNLSVEPAAVRVTLSANSDFADLFEVKEGRVRHLDGIESIAKVDRLWMSYQEDTDARAVTITASGEPITATGKLVWQPVIPPRAEWTVSVQVAPSIDGHEVPPSYFPGQPIEQTRPAEALAAWQAQTPVISTPDEPLTRLIANSAADLGALRIFDLEHPDRPVVAAGAPWFMALFGRDALLTSWMLLPLDAGLALSTVQTLARLQGEKVEPRSEEQPGRILHEVRSGLDAELALRGGSVYYGSIDSTPLFVMLLGELRRWGLASDEVEALLPHADRALEWIERYGDRDGDGFVEYQRMTNRGLINQGWKDSGDPINFVSGRLAEPPIALAEVQGYVYAAYLARAHFARGAGDEDLARHWASKAVDLKRAFNHAFWLPDRGYFALALDGTKRPVDALGSNIGHCLWTGIVDEDKAAAVADRMLDPDMFTGYGVRTLAASMGAYNPMSYHNGSVWPHDNAILAAGLMRYGYVDAAQRIATALFDAAERLGGRLPELFCGFDRADFPDPVPYPTACSPQAWAAASPLFLLRTLLRFDPWIPFGQVWCAPAVPDRYLPLRIDSLHLAGSAVSIEVKPDGWDLGGLPNDVQLVRSPRQPLTATTPSPLIELTKTL
ncbi:MAG TPA: glycogen debranching N-terminal domain-containing protein [Pseudonocardiaceae bacterium]|nr:glycogen debranching N-terminal domain-containing protein [Pseudonocardiaceae bacterium]